jgi:hypothetical protein
MIDMQYHTPPMSTVDPTVKTNRRMCNRRRLISYLFLPLVPGFGKHLLVLMPTDFFPSLLDYISHSILQYVFVGVRN